MIPRIRHGQIKGLDFGSTFAELTKEAITCNSTAIQNATGEIVCYKIAINVGLDGSGFQLWRIEDQLGIILLLLLKRSARIIFTANSTLFMATVGRKADLVTYLHFL